MHEIQTTYIPCAGPSYFSIRNVCQPERLIEIELRNVFVNFDLKIQFEIGKFLIKTLPCEPGLTSFSIKDYLESFL